MLVLSAAEVKRALPMRKAIETQRRAFIGLAAGQAFLPQRLAVPVSAADGVSLFMPARVNQDLGAKIVSVFPHNEGKGIPVVQGLVILIDSQTGQPTALLDGTSLTALRTGAAVGLGTDLLARPDARTGAIIGTGVQALAQLEALCAVRPLEKIWIFSRDPVRVAGFIARMQPTVDAELRPAVSPAEAVRHAVVVCTATPSPTPVFAGTDLQPGCHINGTGSYTLQMQEVDAETVRRAGRVIVDSRSAALAEAGDVVHAIRAGVITEADLVELGEVAADQVAGRKDAAEITFFKSVGLAVQDLAAAAEAVRRAREAGLGTEIVL